MHNVKVGKEVRLGCKHNLAKGALPFCLSDAQQQYNPGCSRKEPELWSYKMMRRQTAIVTSHTNEWQKEKNRKSWAFGVGDEKHPQVQRGTAWHGMMIRGWLASREEEAKKVVVYGFNKRGKCDHRGYSGEIMYTSPFGGQNKKLSFAFIIVEPGCGK
jgi:hypothetical protein